MSVNSPDSCGDATDDELAEVEAMPENYGADERDAELQAEDGPT